MDGRRRSPPARAADRRRVRLTVERTAVPASRSPGPDAGGAFVPCPSVGCAYGLKDAGGNTSSVVGTIQSRCDLGPQENALIRGFSRSVVPKWPHGPDVGSDRWVSVNRERPSDLGFLPPKRASSAPSGRRDLNPRPLDPQSSHQGDFSVKQGKLAVHFVRFRLSRSPTRRPCDPQVVPKNAWAPDRHPLSRVCRNAITPPYREEAEGQLLAPTAAGRRPGAGLRLRGTARRRARSWTAQLVKGPSEVETIGYVSHTGDGAVSDSMYFLW